MYNDLDKLLEELKKHEWIDLVSIFKRKDTINGAMHNSEECQLLMHNPSGITLTSNEQSRIRLAIIGEFKDYNCEFNARHLLVDEIAKDALTISFRARNSSLVLLADGNLEVGTFEYIAVPGIETDDAQAIRRETELRQIADQRVHLGDLTERANTRQQESHNRQSPAAIESDVKGYYFVLAKDDHSVSIGDGQELWGLTNYIDKVAQINAARKSQQRVSIKDITDKILRQAVNQGPAIRLFIICQLGKENNKEYWISIAAKITPKDRIDLYITGRFNFSNQILWKRYTGLKDYITSVVKDIKIEFHETIKNQSAECNIDVAYRAINNFSIFNDIKISYKDGNGSMSHNGMVSDIAGVAFRRWKHEAEVCVSSYQQSLMFSLLMLDKLIKDDNRYVPDIALLYDLTNMVGLEHSESHAWGLDRLRTEVLQLMYYLQNESRIPEGKENIFDNLSRYFNSIKEHTEKDNGKVHYTVSDLEKNIQELKKDSRKDIQDLKNAIKQRMDFLQYQACLSLDTLDVKDFDEFFKLLGQYSRIAGLKKQKEELDTELKDKLGRTNADNRLKDGAKAASEEILVTRQIDINTEQIKLQHELDYLTAIWNILEQLSFDELIIALGQKVGATRDNSLGNKEERNEQDINNKVDFSNETINLIVDVSLKTKNTEVIMAVITILTASNANKISPEVRLKLDAWCKNALQQISHDDYTVNRIIDFAQMLLPDFIVGSVVNYLNQLVIDNQSAAIRQRAFDLLSSKKSLLCEAIQATIELENYCKKYKDSQIEGLLIKLQDHLKAKRPLTFNCFNILSHYLNNSATTEIAIKIIENHIQRLPRFFIDRFISYIKTLTLQDPSVTEESANIIAMSKSFIEGDYISLEAIKGTITLLLDQAGNNDDVLELIFSTIQCGKQIPKTIIDKIEYLSKESVLENNTQLGNVLRLIRHSTPNYTSDEVDILMNPREEREVRQQALDDILKKLISGSLGKSDNEKIYLSKRLISLITYDSDLRSKALEVLATILPENYIEIGYPDLSEMLVQLVANIEVNTIDQKRVLNSLIDISKIAICSDQSRDKFTKKQAMALFGIAINSTNHSLQKKVFNIIWSGVTSGSIEFIMTNINGRLIPIYDAKAIDKIGKSIIIDQIIDNHQPELEKIKKKLNEVDFAVSGEQQQNSQGREPLKLAINVPAEKIIDDKYQYFYVIENPNIRPTNDIQSWSSVISALSLNGKEEGIICEENSLKIPYNFLAESDRQPLKDISQKPIKIITLGDELQRLEAIDQLNDVSQSNIEQINKIISCGYYILADDKIDLLCEKLGGNREHYIDAQIARILLQIDDNQNLTGTHWDQICKVIDTKESLMQIPAIIDLIIRGLYSGKINRHQLNTDKLQQLYLDSERDAENIVINALLALSLQGQEFTSDFLKKLASKLEDSQTDIDVRIDIARVISNAIEHNPNYDSALLAAIIDKLKNVAIEEDPNPVPGSNDKFYDHNLLTSIVFLSLKKEAQEGRLDREFFKKYLDKLKRKLNQKLGLTKPEITTDVFPQVNIDELKPLPKYYLLGAITNNIINSYPLDTTIFTNFGANEWGKELLASELLKIALANSNLASGVSDFQLLKFRNNISRLSYLVNNPSESNIEIENLLQKLIDNCYQFNLEILNSITDMLIALKQHSKAFSNALQILQSNSDNFYPDLRALWLEKHLENISIASAIQAQEEETSKLANQRQEQPAKDKELTILNIYLLPYPTDLIVHTFFKIKDKALTSIADLAEFFNKLNNSNIALEEKKQFLTSTINNSSSVRSWLHKLFSKQIEVYLRERFSIPDSSPLASNTITVGGENIECRLLGKLHTKLTMVIESGWSLSSVNQLVKNIDNKQKFEALVNALDPIYEYSLKEYDSNIRGQNIFTILSDYSTDEWESKIHELAVYNTFTGSYDKELSLLNGEIKKLNSAVNVDILRDDKLIEQHKQVITAYKGGSSLATPSSQCQTGQAKEVEVGVVENLPEKPIENWTDKEIKLWASKIRANSELAQSVELTEKIAVVKRAVEIISRFPPRDVQLLSLLILLNREENKGRLAQINTGEGKTTIVAMLAAIKALEGHKVDIITSSSELAKPQSRQQEKFFNIFGLTVSHNSEDNKAKETRYLSDIVYGAAGDFQGDILRDEYSKLGTLSGRKCDVAIVDEVDSMLIDGRHHIVMLSTPLPGMDHLEPILAAIWIQVREVARCIKKIDGKAYFIESPAALDDEGKLKPDLIDSLYPIKVTIEEFIKQATLQHIKKLLRDESLTIIKDGHPDYDQEWIEYIADEKNNAIEQKKRFPEIKIPQHLRDLVLQCQLSEWIDSAIYAKYRCELNKHYILDKGTIAPVDAVNTGVVQQNMHWNNGLHQFLQIKHGAKITAESLTTNFISNVSYFKRYGSNIYGLTGTLGSDRARKLLDNTYDVDSIIIPPFRKKQYKELTPVIADTEGEWYNNIIETNLSKLRNGRGVLVITQYIKIAAEIARRLKEDYNYDASKIKLYKTSEDSHVVEDKLKPGDIIIATNIAGRGTDIKPNAQVEKNGGLHVCRTSLADKQRVEQQNVGRTSRTGNKGTSQFVLLKTDSDDLTILEKRRNEAENLALDNAEKEIEKVLRQDEVFNEFCRLLEEFRHLDRNDPIIKAIEERFGIWLKMQEQENIPIEQRFKLHDDDDKALDEDIKTNKLLVKFEKFRDEILNNRDRKDSLIKNPCYFVLKGNALLSNKQNKAAIEEFEKAVKLDPYFQVHAYYNMGYARIAEYGDAGQEVNGEISKAKDNLREARRIIEDNLEPMLNLIQQASTSEALSEQVQHKIALYNAQKSAIEQAVGIGSDGMNNKRRAEDQQLNERINKLKINKELSKWSSERYSEEQIKCKAIEFEMKLPAVTQKERDELREKDIKDAVRAQKIAAEETKINKELAEAKENLKKNAALLEAEAKKKAFNNFKNGAEATADEKRFYEEFKKAVDPTNKEFSDKIAEIEKQDNFLKSGTIGQALKNNGLKIKLVDIKKSLPEDQDVSLYIDEIREFRGNGFYGTFEVTEIKPISWWSVIGMGLLALGQMIGGAALTVFSLGAASSIGMGLISEGVSDLITAVKDGIINRSLDWASWAIQKAISLTVSIVCCGLKAIKDAAKTAAAGLNAIGQATTQSIKEGWKLAAKAVGVNLAKSVAKEVVTQLVDYGISNALMPSIEDEIRKRVQGPIQGALTDEKTSLGQIVKKMLELDGKNRNNYYQSLIKRKAMEILNPQNNPEHALLTISKGIAKGIACNKIPYLSTILQISEAVAALDELSSFVPEFIEILRQEMANIALQEKIDEKYSTLIPSNQLPKKHTTATSDLGISKGQEEEPQVKLTDIVKSPDELRATISGSISANMCSIIHGKLIAPIAHAGVKFSMQKLTAGIEQKLQDEIGNYQAERRIQFMASGDKGKRVPDKNGCPSDEAIKKANDMIKDLGDSGEAGLPHLGALSDTTGRPIAVYDEKGRLQYVIGEDKGGEFIKVEYHKNPKVSGHWTLPGGVDASASGTNNCLFDVVAAQTEKNGKDLRKATIAHMQNNLDSLAHQADDITRLEIYKKDALQMGGVIMRGYWDVEDEDITSLIDVIKHQERPERPIFKKSHDSHLTHPEGTNLKYNHIIPANIIEEKLQKADPKKLRVQCSRFIAYPEIKQMLLEHRYAANAIENRSFEGGIALRQVLIWMPNNLVGGPEKNRGDDPDNKIDIPILNHQTKEYQELAKKALEAKPDDFLPLFMKLMEHKPNPVPWITKKNPEGITEWRVARASDLKASQLSEAQKGINIAPFSISGIASIFFEYTMEQIGDILAFRLRAEVNISGLTNTLILPGTYIFSEKSSNIHALLLYINLYFVALILHRNNQAMNIVSPLVILAPISLHGKHAVGVMFVAQEDGSGYKAFYLDPENTSIPAALASIFKENGYEIEQLVTEGQKYTNCGPEVIENFMLYLTGERLSQEDAIVNNSRLVEQELLSFGGAKEEANCLTLKDGYLKQNGVTVLFNAEGKSQASRDGYINNSTRYDIVTPQSIIDEVSVRAEPGTAPGNLLIELLSDYRINQDYAETILGEASSIDIS